MRITANEIYERTGISIPTIRKARKRVAPESSFDKYEQLNGTGEALISELLRGRRTAKETRELRKILSEANQLETDKVREADYQTPSKAAKTRTARIVDSESKPAGKDWRNILAVLPLPMLGLSASYGVYYFASHFAPAIVAGIEAMAFELTYIGLAMQSGLDEAQRKRANRISRYAMIVSVLYNIGAGMMHDVKVDVNTFHWAARLGLSVLHGLPIPALAWAVADLLLHRKEV